jgi:hypothetical protein
LTMKYLRICIVLLAKEPMALLIDLWYAALHTRYTDLLTDGYDL